MRETEIKAIIDKETFERVAGYFKWETVKEQTNSYYTDSSASLKKAGITFRIRTVNDVNKIQIKKHQKTESALQISEETEFEIDNIPEKFTAQEVFELAGIEQEVFLLGSLTTLRHSLFYCDGVEICLDKSEYLDVTDYEIEIEYTNQIPVELKEKLSELGVSFEAKASGKCSRFMKRFAEILNGG